MHWASGDTAYCVSERWWLPRVDQCWDHGVLGITARKGVGKAAMERSEAMEKGGPVWEGCRWVVGSWAFQTEGLCVL